MTEPILLGDQIKLELLADNSQISGPLETTAQNTLRIGSEEPYLIWAPIPEALATGFSLDSIPEWRNGGYFNNLGYINSTLAFD